MPSCAEAGVLGVLPGIVGTIQATEAIKLILGSGDPLVGRLLHFDALKMKFREFNIRGDPHCPVCGESPTITEPIDYEQFCGIRDGEIAAISVSDLKRKIDNGDAVVIVDVREPFEYEIAHIENSKLIPLSDLPDHVEELDRAKEIVALCHTGARSAQAVNFLKGEGFERAFNLAGGIEAWATEIDPTMPRY